MSLRIVADKDIPYLEHYFKAAGELTLKSGRQLGREDLLSADLLLSRSVTPLNQALLQDTPVRYVASISTGQDHIDTAWLDQAGIGWCTAAGFNATPVAQYIVSIVAALELRGRAAVIGVGKIGRQVADYLTALGFEVVLCDPVRAEQEGDFVSTPLEKIADVDLITLHVPLTTSGRYPTHHFITREFLQRQKPGCVFINTARGKAVSTDVLKQSGQHLRLCLDVWENEPNIDRDLLQQVCIATQHIAGYSVQSKWRGTDMIYKKLHAKGVVTHSVESLTLPMQALAFASAPTNWREVVLQVFNPVQQTEKMRAQLAAGVGFDELRRQFTQRNEFGFVRADAAPDQPLLKRLGFAFL